MPNPKIFNNKNYPWKSSIDYRKQPHRYLVGKGEQGVLICEPYKSEILPFWKFKTPEIAQKSANKIYKLFLAYLKQEEFVGADMTRKFLQMGYTRSRRYTNYKGGKKYDENNQLLERGTGEPQKALSAEIFYEKWKRAESNKRYAKMKQTWKEKYG